MRPAVSSSVCSGTAWPRPYFPLCLITLFLSLLPLSLLCLPLLLFRSFLDDVGEG